VSSSGAKEKGKKNKEVRIGFRKTRKEKGKSK